MFTTEESLRMGLTRWKLKKGSHPGFLRSRVCRYNTSVEIFIACIFFSIYSVESLIIVKVLRKTRIWDESQCVDLPWDPLGRQK